MAALACELSLEQPRIPEKIREICMFTLRPSTERGRGNFGWLDSRHTFSFGQYFDRNHMGFGALRVINEDVVAPAQGFGQHRHDNMEIISYVVSGVLAHSDTLGHQQSLGPGEIQYMNAGRGIEHAEFNPSATEPVHFLQIWLKPGVEGTEPRYEQRVIAAEARHNRLGLLASHAGTDGSIRLWQDAELHSGVFTPGAGATHQLAPGRCAWVQLVKGALTVGGTSMIAGDGLAISDESMIELRAGAQGAELLLFDLA
jgi:quercetin 2,3-dioxygenase